LLQKVDERDDPLLDMLPGLALVSIGMGFAVPAMTTSILSGVERHQAWTASAVLNTARQVDGATGVTIFGTIVASGAGAAVMGGVRSAMLISATLLLVAVAIAFRSKAGVAQPPNGYIVARGVERRDGHASG
jgi:MFS transporter, DHA2 family, methylenomycin A resistance protein